MPSASEIYACLLVREFPAQALLRLRPALQATPCAILEGEPPLQVVCSLNRHAARLGITPGMTPVELDTFPRLTILRRSLAEEHSTAKALLECAANFSPRIEQRFKGNQLACVLEISGSENLLGPPAMLAARLLERLHSLGIHAGIAISCNFHVALCVARSSSARPAQVLSIPRGNERQTIAQLPVTLLDLAERHADTLSLWGIHTLEMLANLPEKELVSRLGQEGKRLRLLARGELPHLFQPLDPAFLLEEHMELDTPVELLDSLLFVIRVLLDQLITRAVAKMLALASVTVKLRLEGDALHTRTVRPALPAIDAHVWLKLLQLDLQAHPPSAAIVALTLNAEPGLASRMQLGLFSPQMPEAARLEITLARIRSIVGEDNAGRAVLQDTHRPDACAVSQFAISATPKSFAASPTSHCAAVRQLRPPVEIRVTLQAGHPQAFIFQEKRYNVAQSYGPWTASGDWWNPTLWDHEQWDLVADSPEGSRLACCVVRDRIQDRWQMAALYD
jgi:protein ImuB